MMMAAAICYVKSTLLLLVLVAIANEFPLLNTQAAEHKDTDEYVSETEERHLQDPSNHYFCGIGYADASASCEHPCPSGSTSECPSGYLCYFDTPCDINNLPAQSDTVTNLGTGPNPSINNIPTKTGKPTYPPQPTAAPWAENDPRLSLFCGKDWADASATCQVWCPDGGDDVCPYGQVCFADTSCKYTRPPTNKPTKPQPSQSPTYHPTDPTHSPTVAQILEHPSNHMFCASDVTRVAESCSLETHCPNGPSDCKLGTFCWSNVMECDARDYIPWEEGGFLGRPESATSGMTDKEIALSLGFTWPSLKQSDHYFCGISREDANFRCGKSCTDGTALTCNHGQLCFYDTECDARVHPEYYETNEPTAATTPAPVSRDDRINFSFCGVDWAEANTCTTRWCGLDQDCPEGKSCFADTECNAQDLPPLKPTKTPTWSPVTYDDEANNLFCGETFLDASATCSYETYCRSGEHTECEKGQFCWPGVPCNIRDMVVPTTPRPTMDTAEPSRSPIVYDDPSNTRFCGESWMDASSSCTDGRRPQWCRTGSDTECSPGLICFADTMCHISSVVFPPSESPTTSPTIYNSPEPTDSAPEYDDVIFTSFCGPTYLEASASCSLDTYCPSGIHTDCPDNQYCWAATTCNVQEFWPDPTEKPTHQPTLQYSPSETPSSAPSINPTGLPTQSPLPEDDVRNFLYCGTDWADASATCRIKCPNQICPPPLTCYSGTGCPAIPYDSPAPTDPYPTAAPVLLADDTKSLPPNGSGASSSMVADSSSPSLVSNMDQNSALPSGNPTVQPSTVSSFSIVTANPTATSEDSFVSSTIYPTLANTQQPTSPISDKWTSKPTGELDSSGNKIHTIPDVDPNKTQQPQPLVIQTVQNLLQDIRPALESDVFVVETRGGSFTPSNVFKFDGFLSSLLRYTETGIDNDHFYLGEDNDTIEGGLVNLALFCAKIVSDAISYESCEASKLACGIWGLETTFKDKTRFQCSHTSENAGFECLDANIGCACILGMLDHHIGTKSSEPNAYSTVSFCSTDPYESVCSKYLQGGEDLRWLTPMSYWVTFVQRYQYTRSQVTETYKQRLKSYVETGMQDKAFLEFVADISIHASIKRAPKEKFLDTYQKVINLLLDDLKVAEPEQSTVLSTRFPTSSSLSHPTVAPYTSPNTSVPSALDNDQHEGPSDSESLLSDDQSLSKKCPFICVIPIKTTECPSPSRKLKHCFSDFIGIDELCMANYGECDTSEHSINGCGKSYNVFKRIDCSTVVDYQYSEGKQALKPIESPSPEPVSTSVPNSSRNEDSWVLVSARPSSSETPTTKPTIFGGIVWWENVTSSAKRNYQTSHMTLIFITAIILCITTSH